jgi:hypothetical protein
MRFIVFLSVLFVCGCASKPYIDTADSKFVGDLEVRWVENDYFLFLPKEGNPLRLIRPNGQRPIQPGPMYTDGGSIPQALWGFPGLSPWGYAPAYVVHDWLFEAHHCGYAPDDQYSFDDSVTVIAEGLKAIMESDPRTRNQFVFDAVVGAVGSPVAKNLWDKGKCKPPPANAMTIEKGKPPGILIRTFEFK